VNTARHTNRLRVLLPIAALIVALIAINTLLPDIDLDQALHDVADKLGSFTYVLVGLAAFLETGAFVGLLLPGETAVILGGAVAGQGETSIVLTIGIVWACAWGGDSVSFLVGRKLGREFVMRHGPKVRITRERFARVESYFSRHGGKTILIGRFIGLVRALAPFTAGSSGMRYRDFVPFSILGTGLWAAVFALVGYFAARSLDRASELVGQGSLVFAITVGVVFALVMAIRYLREEANRKRLVERMEAMAVTRPLVALGRRAAPPARFLAGRLTPGGLGLEFTALIAALAVALYVLIAYAVTISADPAPTPGDAGAFDLVRHLQTPFLTSLAKAITELGSAVVVIPIGVASAVFLAIRRRIGETVVLVVALVIIFVVGPELKDAIGRPRPMGSLVGTEGLAFPSGHAAQAIIYPWLALTLTVRLRPGMVGASALIVAGIALAVLIGLTRVYLRAHYLSDVIGGWALGVAAFALCATVAMLVGHFRNHSRDAPPGDRD